MERYEINPVRIYCPNCGYKIAGDTDEKGVMRVTCRKCGIIIFSKHHKKKEIDIKVIKQ